MQGTSEDSERHPTLTEHGARMLRLLREHPNAPMFRNESGSRLTKEDVERVRNFEREVESAAVRVATIPPPWVEGLLAECYANVPHFRRLGSPPSELREVPTTSRSDLARNIESFVPDGVSVERLINFRTTGTTGQPLLVASHPVVAAGYLAFHKRAFRRFGVELRHGRGRVGVILLGFQKQCFTYVSVTPSMDESGLAKINLHPDDWRDPADRARYLSAMNPEVLAGDPISFAELLKLDLELRPKVISSTSMMLTRGLRDLLGERFGCPVVDLYSLNEAGPIAVYDERARGHVLLQHRMFVEILSADDEPVRPGERGEVTLTGGFNFCLPLVRYRTGDHATLETYGDEPVLRGLEGREPVIFETAAGELINNVDVTHALSPLSISQYSLHQHGDGSLTLTLVGSHASEQEVRDRLLALFGRDQRLLIRVAERTEGKLVQYASDLMRGPS